MRLCLWFDLFSIASGFPVRSTAFGVAFHGEFSSSELRYSNCGPSVIWTYETVVLLSVLARTTNRARLVGRRA
ncbi:hypothetical protein BO71DRAFT_221024 [Aspergillus ellipticus CBS 707.79]|uniref:Secreted protein n=1 Tax=Aspergillus ellipticus CBS 707.79 TaxID=1448320 RepID=A0A319DCC1_9EURO|nr:hypothetical protein BO71DRAFT_221024 [Aspergillus ellipticus CBS 707.79]